MENEVNLLI